jgi:hypothetical protein
MAKSKSKSKSKTPRYAEGTTVPARRSREEIERLAVDLHACKGFTYCEAEEGHAAAIFFSFGGRVVRFLVPIPGESEFARDPRGHSRTADAREKLRQAEIRRRWRVLLMRIKMRFEEVDAGLSTPDEAFLPFYVAASGETLAEALPRDFDRILMPTSARPALPSPRR